MHDDDGNDFDAIHLFDIVSGDEFGHLLNGSFSLPLFLITVKSSSLSIILFLSLVPQIQFPACVVFLLTFRFLYQFQ